MAGTIDIEQYVELLGQFAENVEAWRQRFRPGATVPMEELLLHVM